MINGQLFVLVTDDHDYFKTILVYYSKLCMHYFVVIQTMNRIFIINK